MRDAPLQDPGTGGFNPILFAMVETVPRPFVSRAKLLSRLARVLNRVSPVKALISGLEDAPTM
ncbi:hypothetical protein TRAPUB_6037 [Trametes pubescens]|uniref:Uncharacterized protein n=1 Tax=Trametes pubescens TaxID=154538 RepID=A0A1M2V6Z4_TRAPU|nr:hypothetical protein TRAPUB_6037 [Trametes pubescens]